MFQQNKGTQNEFPYNGWLQAFLEDLEWIFQQDTYHNRAWQFLKIKSIEQKSVVLAMILRNLQPIKLGNFSYYRAGSDRLERSGPSIKPTEIKNKFFNVERIFKKKPETAKGVVQVLD